MIFCRTPLRRFIKQGLIHVPFFPVRQHRAAGMTDAECWRNFLPARLATFHRAILRHSHQRRLIRPVIFWPSRLRRFSERHLTRTTDFLSSSHCVGL